MSKLDVTLLKGNLKNEVERVGLYSAEKVLLMTNEEFFELGNFSLKDIKILKETAAKTILPIGFRRVSTIEDHLKKKWKFITFECSQIDELLEGGIPTRGITELSGESGTGKTQFCLQYSITVQYPADEGGLGRGAVYICTEDRFPSPRLQQLLGHFPRKIFKNRVAQCNNFSDNIFVVHIATVESLKECLYARLPRMLEKNHIGLLVIDSIAAVFRGEYTTSQSVSRAKDLREIGTQLHKIAKYFGIAVLCVNQVTDAIDSGNTIPALGLVWANLVTTKLQLRMTPERNRTFYLLSAPHLPPGSVPYKIEPTGIVTDNLSTSTFKN